MMLDTCHPVYYRLHKLGKTVEQGDILNTFYTYMTLCEVKRFWDVNYHYNEALNLLYITARKSKNSELEIYITVSVLRDISLEDIENLQKELETKSIILVFKEGDTSSVYYKVSNSLIKPLSPEESKRIKQKEEKKYELEKEIKRNTSNLFEMAKTLNKKDDKSEITEDNLAGKSDDRSDINEDNLANKLEEESKQVTETM